MDTILTLPPSTPVRRNFRLAGLSLLAALALAALAATAAPAAAATLSVTTLLDQAPATNGNCTLREALLAAQLNSARDLCPAGQAGVADVIVLPAGVLQWNGGEHVESGAGGPVVLRGPVTTPPAAQIEIDAVTKGRFLKLLSGAGVTLANLEIRHGDVYADPTERVGGAIMAREVSNVNLTLRNVVLDGNVAGYGGGLYFETTSDCDPCSLTIERSVIATNLAAIDDMAAAARGGGVFLGISGETTVRIQDTRFQVNRVATSFGSNPAIGGGLYAELGDTALVHLRRVVFDGNSAAADSSGPSAGGGAWISATDMSSLDIVDATFEHNNLEEPTAADGNYRATALYLQTSLESSFYVDRMKLVDNDPGDIAVDLRVEHLSQFQATMRNVVVGGGAGRGARISNGAGALLLAHWTVANHEVEELRLERGSAELRLENSILDGNTHLIVSGSPTIDTTNIIGFDPFFVNPAGGDYRLTAQSNAIDFGNSTYPSVARYDAGHGARVIGIDTDAGAYEYGAVFNDDFESGSSEAWNFEP